MAYGDPLDPVTPADNASVGQGDDRMRELKRALRQRLGSFFKNVDDDPLVPKDGILTDAMFTDNSIDGSRIKVASIAPDRIVGGVGGGSGTVTDDSVYTNAIQNLAVTAAKLAANSVITSKIADGAVTADKIAAGALSSATVGDGSITRIKLSDTLKSGLAHMQVTAFTFPSSTTIAGGVSYIVSMAVDTLAVQQQYTIVTLQPEITFSEGGSTHWSDAIIMHGAISSSPATFLIMRFHNSSSAPIDVSGKRIFIGICQALLEAPTD